MEEGPMNLEEIIEMEQELPEPDMERDEFPEHYLAREDILNPVTGPADYLETTLNPEYLPDEVDKSLLEVTGAIEKAKETASEPNVPSEPKEIIRAIEPPLEIPVPREEIEVIEKPKGGYFIKGFFRPSGKEPEKGR